MAHCSAATGIELVSFFSQSGLHGEVHFMKSTNNPKLVKVKAFLETTIQYPEQSWTWGVHQNPVDYSIIDPVERCDLDHVGPQIVSFDDVLGYLLMPGNESSVWEDAKLNLTGELSINSIKKCLMSKVSFKKARTASGDDLWCFSAPIRTFAFAPH